MIHDGKPEIKNPVILALRGCNQSKLKEKDGGVRWVFPSHPFPKNVWSVEEQVYSTVKDTPPSPPGLASDMGGQPQRI
jgi:hypothetical protein